MLVAQTADYAGFKKAVAELASPNRTIMYTFAAGNFQVVAVFGGRDLAVKTGVIAGQPATFTADFPDAILIDSQTTA